VGTAIAAGQGATYDDAGNSISVLPSTDVGNQIVQGTDGRLYTPANTLDCELVQDCVGIATNAGTGITYNDAGNSFSVLPSADPNNTIVVGTDGKLYATTNCEQVQDCVGMAISNGDGLFYDDAANAISACLSADGGNALIFGTDGCLYVPAAAAGGSIVNVLDTPTVDLTITGNGNVGTPYVISGVVNLSANVGQILHLGTDNRFLLTCADILACVPTTPMASAKMTMSATQTVPASGGGCVSVLTGLTYDATEFSSGTITPNPGAGSITIGATGRYLIEGSQRDNNTINSSHTTPGAEYAVGMIIDVNGIQRANVSMSRSAQQTHVPTPHTELNLNAGDVVTTRFVIHRDNAATIPHTLTGDASLNFLSVQQVPLPVCL
jgi:hypothetical protein